ENTELLYNDEIARLAEGMGYKGIFTEGIIANPNHVYRPVGTEISLLLRNYQLTDDVGFRFSARSWEEYPLMADKYSAWLSATPGDCINIFCDYETFGEHQWPETGIMEFLKHLPGEVLKWQNLQFKMPREIARDNQPAGEISVRDTVSWADLERNTSCWLGNALQWACYLYEKRLDKPVKETEDAELLRIWRLLGQSDHLYYIFTHGGGPGEVHSYFSPYGNPYDAAVTFFSALSDLQFRVKALIEVADQPFEFATGEEEPTGEEAWSAKALCKVLEKVDVCSLEYHMDKGDLAAWARTSLHDEAMAERIEKSSDMRGEKLRRKLVKAVKIVPRGAA
ncbi:MAG TPA: alpha-amylase, partial [Methanotrichaceae archaeon]|nr:alpha-amylase [Methanotrichaceae archaeon]